MTNLKRWRQLGQAQYTKWDTPGQEIIGNWCGQKDGKPSPDGKPTFLGVVETPEGRVSFALTTVLQDRLKEVELGEEIKIVYVGQKTSQSGARFKAFDVFVATTDGEIPPSVDEDIPF